MTPVPVSPSNDQVELRFPVIGALHRYWLSLNNGHVPQRQLVDPAGFRDLLPYIMIVEFEAAPFRVRYRLTGTLVDSATGFNLTNHYLDEYLVEPIAEDIRRLLDAYERVYRQGTAEIGVYTWAGGQRTMQVGYGMFPLLVDGKVGQALVAEQEWQLDPHEQVPTWKEAIEARVV